MTGIETGGMIFVQIQRSGIDRKNMPVPVPALRHRLTNGSIHEPMIKDDRKIIFV
jgi:hypothetical protein